MNEAEHAVSEPPRSASPLSSRPFRWLLGGQIVSMIGSQLSPMVIVALTVPGAERPALAMGLVMGARFGALALFIVLGGVLADRVDRFRLLALTDLLAIAALAPIIVLGADTPLLVVGASAFMLGAGEALFIPTYDAAVVSVVDRHQLARANAASKAVRGIAKVCGPPAAAVVVVIVGVKGAVLLDALSFGLSFLTLVRLTLLGIGGPARSQQQSIWREAFGGVRMVVSMRWLRAFELLAVVHVLFAVAPWLVLLPVLAERQLGGLETYGMLLGAFAAGAVPGALLGARLRPRLPGVMVLAALLPFGLACLMLAHTEQLWALAAIFFVAGAGIEFADVLKMTAIQVQVPESFLGRVFALDFFASLVTMPLGQFLTGLFVVPGSEAWALSVAGAVVLVTTPLLVFVPGLPTLGEQRSDDER